MDHLNQVTIQIIRELDGISMGILIYRISMGIDGNSMICMVIEGFFNAIAIGLVWN
jgi:hypothetical protein